MEVFFGCWAGFIGLFALAWYKKNRPVSRKTLYAAVKRVQYS